MEAGLAKFGDGEAAITLLKEVGKGTPLGRILGNGAAVTGKVFGVERVPVVKGQALPAYDPRSVQGMGVTYATSTMGADNAMLDMLGAFTGQNLTADDVVALGKKILDHERDFNTRAGFTSTQDRLPDFFKNEPLPPHNVTFEVKDQDLDQVFNWNNL